MSADPDSSVPDWAYRPAKLPVDAPAPAADTSSTPAPARSNAVRHSSSGPLSGQTSSTSPPAATATAAIVVTP